MCRSVGITYLRSTEQVTAGLPIEVSQRAPTAQLSAEPQKAAGVAPFTMERAPQRDRWPDAGGAGSRGVYYSEVYHPLQAGSIDGTDLTPHDHAIKRALVVHKNGLCESLFGFEV